jgi:hypothetical protein
MLPYHCSAVHVTEDDIHCFDESHHCVEETPLNPAKTYTPNPGAPSTEMEASGCDAIYLHEDAEILLNSIPRKCIDDFKMMQLVTAVEDAATCILPVDT